MELNNVAILLTQKIALDLLKSHGVSVSSKPVEDSVTMDMRYISGSFYQVRESILKALSEVVSVIGVDYKWSPEEVQRNHDKDEYEKYRLDRACRDMANNIFKSNFVKVDSWQPDQAWGWMREDTYTIAVIDLNKVKVK